MRFGLSNRDEGYIVEALKNFPAIEKVIVFGSRAMGNYEKIQNENIKRHVDNEGKEFFSKIA